MGAEQSLQQQRSLMSEGERERGQSRQGAGGVVQARVPGDFNRQRSQAGATGARYNNEYGESSIFQNQSMAPNTFHAHSQVVSGTDMMHQSQLLEAGNMTAGLQSQRSAQNHEQPRTALGIASTGRGSNQKLTASASRQEISSRSNIFGGGAHPQQQNLLKLTKQNDRRNVTSAQASHASGFNSQNSQSKRIGPSFGSGAYSQKQKVGVLEPTHQTLGHGTGKYSDKQSQGASRKSAGASSVYKSNNLVRPGFANKPSNAKGYDQFQAKTTNVLEEMMAVVHYQTDQTNLMQFKQLKNLSDNFEESLRQVINERQRSLGQTQQIRHLEVNEDSQSNDFGHDASLALKSQSKQNISSNTINEAALLRSSPKSLQGRQPPSKGFGLGNEIIATSGSHTTNPNGRPKPGDPARAPFALNRQEKSNDEVGQRGQRTQGQPRHQQESRTELKRQIEEHLLLNVALVLKDDDDPSHLSQIEKQISSFSIVEGQKYQRSRFASSKAILAKLGEELDRRGPRFNLVNSWNNQRFGGSDKQIQSLISSLNQQNLRLLQTIIEYQQSEGKQNATDLNTKLLNHLPPHNQHSSMAFSLDHSIDVMPFSNSGSNNQTPLRKDNSLHLGISLKQTEQRPVQAFSNKESMIMDQVNSRQRIVGGGEASVGTGNNSINNSMLRNNQGSPVAGGAGAPRITSSQQYLSQLNQQKVQSENEYEGDKQDINAVDEEGNLNMTGKDSNLDLRSKKVKTVRIKEDHSGAGVDQQAQPRFRSLNQVQNKGQAHTSQNASSKNRDSSKGSSKMKPQSAQNQINQAYEYDMMTKRPMAQANKAMLGMEKSNNGKISLKQMNQTPPCGAVNLQDFQEDSKAAIRDGKVASMPQNNTLNNISLLKSQDKRATKQGQNQGGNLRQRPLTSLSKNNQNKSSYFNLSKAADSTKKHQLQLPTPQPDVYYGDYDGKDGANSIDDDIDASESQMPNSYRQQRSSRQNITNANKDNQFKQKKKSATTDKKPALSGLNSTQRNNASSVSRHSNCKPQQIIKSNFIRKGGAAVSKPVGTGQRQQRIIGPKNAGVPSHSSRKSQLRSQEPRQQVNANKDSDYSIADGQKGKAHQTVDVMNQPEFIHENQGESSTLIGKARNNSGNNKMRTIQTVQVDFDADMPVEGRNGEEDGNYSPASMAFEKKAQRDGVGSSEGKGLNDFRGQQQKKISDNQQIVQKPALGPNEEADLPNSAHQNEQVMEQSMTKPVQSIQSLENLVKLRQKLDKDLSNQRHTGSQSILKNEQKNANKALEVIQQNMLKETATSNLLTLEGQNSNNTLSRPPLTLKEQFERDYLYPPSSEEYRPIDLPDRVMLTILQYWGMRHIVKLQKLSRHWYCKVQQVFDKMSQPMEERFKTTYHDYFNFIKSKIVIGPTEFGQLRGIRIDRIMEIQLKESSPDVLRNAGKTFKIENEYRYQDTDRHGNPSTSKFFVGDREDQMRDVPQRQSQKSVVFRPQGRQASYQKNQSIVYHNVYRFDIIKSRSRPRSSWIHLSDRMPGYSQNEIQVAPGDRVLVGFCIYNLNGFVDISTLQWATPSFAKIHDSMVNFLSYNREEQIQRFTDRKAARGLKILCDIDRICEVEDSVYDWYKYDITGHRKTQTPIQMPIVIPPNLFEYFEVLDVWYNESDQHYNKKLLKAIKPSFDKRPGSTTNFNLILQFDERRRFSLSILPRESPIINEIRRRGVVTDRNKTEEEVQIRVGDIIMLYETKHIPQELQMITNLGD